MKREDKEGCDKGPPQSVDWSVWTLFFSERKDIAEGPCAKGRSHDRGLASMRALSCARRASQADGEGRGVAGALYCAPLARCPCRRAGQGESVFLSGVRRVKKAENYCLQDNGLVLCTRGAKCSECGWYAKKPEPCP